MSAESNKEKETRNSAHERRTDDRTPSVRRVRKLSFWRIATTSDFAHPLLCDYDECRGMMGSDEVMFLILSEDVGKRREGRNEWLQNMFAMCEMSVVVQSLEQLFGRK